MSNSAVLSSGCWGPPGASSRSDEQKTADEERSTEGQREDRHAPESHSFHIGQCEFSLGHRNPQTESVFGVVQYQLNRHLTSVSALNSSVSYVKYEVFLMSSCYATIQPKRVTSPSFLTLSSLSHLSVCITHLSPVHTLSVPAT